MTSLEGRPFSTDGMYARWEERKGEKKMILMMNQDLPALCRINVHLYIVHVEDNSNNH